MNSFTQRNYSVRRFASMGILAVCTLLWSCGSSENITLAKQAVEQFHSQLNSEQYRVVYVAADEKFHNITSESDFTKLLQAVHGKLGTVQRSDLRNTGVAWYAGQGATVSLVYNTRFSAGSGIEQFVWHINDNRATLYGYHISSNDLVTK